MEALFTYGGILIIVIRQYADHLNNDFQSTIQYIISFLNKHVQTNILFNNIILVMTVDVSLIDINVNLFHIYIKIIVNIK